MANQFLRSLALVGAVVFVPVTAASLAQTDVNSYRELDQFMNVFERVKAEYVDQRYNNYPVTDIKSGGRFHGILLQGVVGF